MSGVAGGPNEVDGSDGADEAGPLRRLAARDYRREGIEMFLALDDLRGGEPGPPLDGGAGAALADRAAATARRLMAARPDDPVRALRNALELVAARDFGDPELWRGDAAAPPDPNTSGAGRPPLRIAADPASGAATLARALRSGRFVRAVNFHHTLPADAARIERRLRALAARFETVDAATLGDLAAGAPWRGARPPLALVFYEGYREHFEVVAPLLRELDLTGIFCLVPGFLDAAPAEQRAFGAATWLLQRDEPALRPAGERRALSWDEARELAARGHGFACHTMSHADPTDEGTDLRRESVDAVARMERELGVAVDLFVWLRGHEWGVSAEADRLLGEAGVRTLLSNFRVQRLPVP